MAITDSASTGLSVSSGERQNWIRANRGLMLGIFVLLVILYLPTPAGLSIAGQRMGGQYGIDLGS